MSAAHHGLAQVGPSPLDPAVTQQCSDTNTTRRTRSSPSRYSTGGLIQTQCPYSLNHERYSKFNSTHILLRGGSLCTKTETKSYHSSLSRAKSTPPRVTTRWARSKSRSDSPKWPREDGGPLSVMLPTVCRFDSFHASQRCSAS